MSASPGLCSCANEKPRRYNESYELGMCNSRKEGGMAALLQVLSYSAVWHSII